MKTALPGYTEKDNALAEFVHTRISARQAAYIRRESEALAAMAKLRRGIGAGPGLLPDLWELTLKDLPEELESPAGFSPDERAGASTMWERAVYDAMTIHALHQQSRGTPMHRRGGTLGSAVRRLGVDSNAEQAVRARFHVIGTAQDHDSRLVHLRGLVGQLRTYEIPLDYSRLATDLRKLDDGTCSDRVLLAWGRDYHRSPARPTDAADQTGEEQ